MHDCAIEKVPGTQACTLHKREWEKHVQTHTRETFHGARRMLKRPGENLPWQPVSEANIQPHDVLAPQTKSKNYFTAPHFYCVETICAPCGVVIAWAKFAKAESPTNILNFLESVYPTEESRPNYICIDKACLVLCTALLNGSWDHVWKETSRFIVDSLHYNNHKITDELCQRWCNPAPQDGSAPNLVVVANNDIGEPYLK